jgi:ribosomal protein S3
MESGAKGCEVVVSGKLRAARAKSMKFTDGFMIHSGQPALEFVDQAVRHVLLRQGVLGIKVKMCVEFLDAPEVAKYALACSDTTRKVVRGLTTPYQMSSAVRTTRGVFINI